MATRNLRARAQSLLDKTVNAKSELSTETESVSQVVVQLKNRVDALEDELTQELEETITAIAALDDGIETQTPEIEESLKEAEDALTSLQDKEIGSEVEEKVSQTEGYLQEVDGEIESHQTAIKKRSEALQAYIFEQCLPEITTRVTLFAEQLEGVLAKLTEKLQVVEDRALMSTDSALP